MSKTEHSVESVSLTEENRIRELHAKVKIDRNNQVILKGNIVNSLVKFIAGDAMCRLENFQYKHEFVIERTSAGILQIRSPLHKSKRYQGGK